MFARSKRTRQKRIEEAERASAHRIALEALAGDIDAHSNDRGQWRAHNTRSLDRMSPAEAMIARAEAAQHAGPTRSSEGAPLLRPWRRGIPRRLRSTSYVRVIDALLRLRHDDPGALELAASASTLAEHLLGLEARMSELTEAARTHSVELSGHPGARSIREQVAEIEHALETLADQLTARREALNAAAAAERDADTAARMHARELEALQILGTPSPRASMEALAALEAARSALGVSVADVRENTENLVERTRALEALRMDTRWIP